MTDTDKAREIKSNFEVWLGFIPDLTEEGDYLDLYVSSAFSAWKHQQAIIESLRRAIEEKDGEIAATQKELDSVVHAFGEAQDEFDTEIERLQARVKEWQPIETAPNDTEILVSGFIYDDDRNGRFVCSAIRHEGFNHFSAPGAEDEYNGPYAPTHWMELPEPPIKP